MDSSPVSALIVASGAGKRFNETTPKQFTYIHSKMIIEWTLDTFISLLGDYIDEIILLLPEACMEKKGEIIQKNYPAITIMPGGESREKTVALGLSQVTTPYVIIHDGVRPFIQRDIIIQTILATKKHRAAMVAIPMTDTVKMIDNGHIIKTLNRDELVLAQTPQGFETDLLMKAMNTVHTKGTDESFLMEEIGIFPKIVAGDINNMKITTPGDLLFASFLLEKLKATQ